MSRRPIPDQRGPDQRGGLGAFAIAREAWLRAPVDDKAARSRHTVQRALRNVGYLVFFIAVAAAVTWLQTLLLQRANLIVTEMITCLLAVVVIWYIEFHREKLRREAELAALMAAAGETLRNLSFSDGGTGDFQPAGVIRTTGQFIVAVDPKRQLLRVITLVKPPLQPIDWVFALPNKLELDVALHPGSHQARRGGPSQPARLSLVFSEEQEDGFRTVAWPLAAESIPTAEQEVAALRANRT